MCVVFLVESNADDSEDRGSLIDIAGAALTVPAFGPGGAIVSFCHIQQGYSCGRDGIVRKYRVIGRTIRVPLKWHPCPILTLTLNLFQIHPIKRESISDLLFLVVSGAMAELSLVILYWRQ